jgi:tetratricopeptide (TPR) repeat protein
MYVYLSPEVESAAQEHGIKDRLDLLVQRIESDASLFSLLFSSRFPLWVRRIRKNLRLIAALKRYGEDQVLCCSQILTRGGNEYRTFLDNPEQWGQQHLRLAPVTGWLAQRRHHTPVVPSPLPEVVYPWLQSPTLAQRADQVIFESEAWVESFRDEQSPLREQLDALYRILTRLLNIASPPCDSSSTSIPQLRQCVDSETNCTVLFREVRPADAPHRTILFLIAALSHPPSEMEIRQIGAKTQLFGDRAPSSWLTANTDPTANDLAQYARRSYPDFIVWEFESWQAIERETQTNLALSGEEEELLHNLHFPAFINGRAGSGKSTMLHYAFAYYCDLYLRELATLGEQVPARPLFLTYSDRLTEKARTTVQQILSSHARYMGATRQFTSAQMDALKDCFQPFQTFLRNCLPDPENERFQPRNYVSFYEFKQRYAKAFPQQRLSAEMCWHTIRTYIKGYHFAEDQEPQSLEQRGVLSVEEYRDEIAKAHKKVSDTDFQTIYEEVWDWYRRQCDRDRLWDDQDLAQAVLQGMAAGTIDAGGYAAIFCDEAQDFTRIELQLILRLSVWSSYQLPHGIDSLPFAFAGDPLQTLNPTGFNWDSFRANFYEKILEPLDPDGGRRLRQGENLALHELQQNYRSPADIVKFTNYVHLWRRILFNIRSLEPQKPWRLHASPVYTPTPSSGSHPRPGSGFPQKGILGKNIMAAELKTFAESGATFLLPCDDGGEIDWLRRSPDLKAIFPTVASHKIPPRVRTAVGIKGLELSPIVVCCFGDYYANQIGKIPLHELLESKNVSKIDTLKLEYFLNKLYVAVSRSTDYLAIVDTAEGDRLLWQAATTEQLEQWLGHLRGTTSPDQWKAAIRPLRTTITTLRANQIDFQANGKQWLLHGIDNRTIADIETAILDYERGDRSLEVRYCQAWILWLQGHYQDAGQQFMTLEALSDPDFSPLQDGWQCFWEGQCWADLKTWIQEHGATHPAQASLQPLLALMGNEENHTLAQLTACAQFLEQLTEQTWRSRRSDATWKAILDRYLQVLANVLDDPPVVESSVWTAWSQALQHLASLGGNPETSLRLAGQCLFQAQEWGQAVDLWEQAKQIQHPDYYLAKAELESPPENLSWLAQAQRYDRIVQIWQAGDRPTTGPWESVLSLVREALEQTQAHRECLALEIQTGRWLAAVDLCEQRELENADWFKVVEAMAHAVNLTPESTRNQRDRLSEFVLQTVSRPGWKPTENRVLEACVAIEKIGKYGAALSLFERCIQHWQTTCRIQVYAQQRWLVVKEKQALFAQDRGRFGEAARYREERSRKAQDWGVSLNDLSDAVSTLPLVQFLALPEGSPSTAQPLNPISAEIENLASLRQETIDAIQDLNADELHHLRHYIQFLHYSRTSLPE